MSTSNEAEALCQQAREAVRRRQIPEGIALYEQVLAADERNVKAHEGIATAAFMVGDYDRAEQHFKRLSILDTKRADPLVNLGAVYNRRGDHDAAVKALRQALTKNRKCAEAYYNLGIAHRGQNQVSMAISAYKEAIRLAPQMAEAYQNLGNAYVEMGNLQQAQLNFQRAIDINPSFEKARRGLEMARQKSQDAAKTTNPFGRLVDVNEMRQKESVAARFRDLTDEERLEDRTFVHRLARNFDKAAGDVLTHLQGKLMPSLLVVSHSFAQSDDKQLVAGGHDALVTALEGHRSSLKALMAFGDELAAHEDSMQVRVQRQAV
jgi:tetratricopeptide (TPR) repeat protein